MINYALTHTFSSHYSPLSVYSFVSRIFIASLYGQNNMESTTCCNKASTYNCKIDANCFLHARLEYARETFNVERSVFKVPPDALVDASAWRLRVELHKTVYQACYIVTIDNLCAEKNVDFYRLLVNLYLYFLLLHYILDMIRYTCTCLPYFCFHSLR